MGLLAALPLPVRLIFFALAGLLATKLLSGFGWLFGLVAALLWSIAILTLAHATQLIRGLERVPGLGVVLGWISGRTTTHAPSPLPSPVTTQTPGVTPSRASTASPSPAVQPSDEERDRMLHQASKVLNDFRGIDEARRAIAGFMDVAEAAQRRGQSGLGTNAPAVVLALTGGHGTGRTTVAKLLGPLLCGHRTLERPQVTKVTEQDLSGGYGVQVGMAVQQAARTAAGGVLLLDDADWIAEDQPSGGMRAGLDAGRGILQAAEAEPGRLLIALTLSEASFRRLRKDPQHRADWLGKMLVEEIRFPQILPEDDLLALLEEQLSGHGLIVEAAVLPALRTQIKAMQRELDPHFDNAIAMRRLAEQIMRWTLQRSQTHDEGQDGNRITLSDIRELES